MPHVVYAALVLLILVDELDDGGGKDKRRTKRSPGRFGHSSPRHWTEFQFAPHCRRGNVVLCSLPPRYEQRNLFLILSCSETGPRPLSLASALEHPSTSSPTAASTNYRFKRPYTRP